MTVTMLNAAQVAALLPLPLASVYRHARRKEADPTYPFPQPYRLGPRVLRFRAEDIAELLGVSVDRLKVAA